jgi:nucleotide-binding universal stress UspA family protein
MKRFSNVLLIADVALENSKAMERAVEFALNNQASLTLIDIVDDFSTEIQMAVTAVTGEKLSDMMVSEKRKHLEKIVNATEMKGVDIEVKVLVGKPFLEIIRQVLRYKYDLVIKCVDISKRIGGGIFGSTDMHLIRKCPCPVWMIKHPDYERYSNILAAVDLDPEDTQRDSLNRPILEIATSLALAESSELHIVHAWEFPAESFLRSPRTEHTAAEVDAMIEEERVQRKKWLEQLVDEHSAAVGKEAVEFVMPKLHLVQGNARRAVPEKARELGVDLIVMGTVARAGIPGFFMGNTAESILNQIDCSVLTIKPPGFESPVSL